MKQNCPDPALNANIVKVGTDNVAACTAGYGDSTGQIGETCTRNAAHDDDCAKGLHCSQPARRRSSAGSSVRLMSIARKASGARL